MDTPNFGEESQLNERVRECDSLDLAPTTTPSIIMTDRSNHDLLLGFARTWDLRQTMIFEEVYHENLRMDADEKADLLKQAEAVWLYERGSRRLIGETYGIPIRDALDEDEDGFDDLVPFKHQKALYIFSTTILPAFQGRGLGTILKAFFLGVVSQAGFDIVLGHARNGASLHLNRTFGAEIRAVHEDWYGTGEPYSFYVIKPMSRESNHAH